MSSIVSIAIRMKKLPDSEASAARLHDIEMRADLVFDTDKEIS